MIQIKNSVSRTYFRSRCVGALRRSRPALLTFALAMAAVQVTACATTRSTAAKETLVTGEQQSISQRFATLDDYLHWLREHERPVDGAWYLEVEPGIYELQTGGGLHLDVPDGGKRRFTRAELEQKFGFKS